VRQEYPEVEYFRGIEVQTRGALHDHSMVWSPVPLEKTWLREVAMDAGFGHSLDLADVQPGSKREAYYVSKYVTKATDARADVPWLGEVVDTSTGEVGVGQVEARYRTWSMSRKWGDTMATVRAAASEYARKKRHELGARSEGEALAALAAVLGAVTTIPEAANSP
jgi:glutamine synthetase